MDWESVSTRATVPCRGRPATGTSIGLRGSQLPSGPGRLLEARRQWLELCRLRRWPRRRVWGRSLSDRSPRPSARGGRRAELQQRGPTRGSTFPAHADFDFGANTSFSFEYWMMTPESSTCSGNQVVIGRDDPESSLHWWTGCLDGGAPGFYAISSTGGRDRLRPRVYRHHRRQLAPRRGGARRFGQRSVSLPGRESRLPTRPVPSTSPGTSPRRAPRSISAGSI